MPPSKKPRASTQSKQEKILYRNKTVVVTYDYWYNVKRKRHDDVMKILVDCFFLEEHTIYYDVLKKTTLTEEDKATIKPIMRIK